MSRLRRPSRLSQRCFRVLQLVLIVATLITIFRGWVQITARAATTFVVTNTNDSEAGSLRQAILDANSSPGLDTIAFNLPSGSLTIIPVLNLPAITDPVLIDGTTQPGFAGTPVVELKGTNPSVGLSIEAPGSTVRSLVVNGFGNTGIAIRSAGSGSHVEGCYIGTDVTGTVAVPNNGSGITITSSNNVIGGTTAAARNVISGNADSGIDIVQFCCTGLNPTASGNVVQGNFIGTDATGTAALPNQREGVSISTSAPDASATGNLIGGTVPGAGNVISGNRYVGVFIGSFQTTGNVVQGNFIGTDVTGSLPIPNADDGVKIDVGRNNIIGGSTPAARNVISGNGISSGGNGVSVGSTGNIVRGNFIGTNAAGNAPMPNLLHGVAVSGTNNTIGGTAPGEGNVIAFNGFVGIRCADPAALGHSFRGNSIFSNGSLASTDTSIGIDLGTSGVTPNDSGDGDTGANTLQNFPTITSVTVGSGSVNIQGTLNSTASTTFALDFYANSVCDSLGFGEGARRIGSGDVTTDGSGNGNFDFNFTLSLPPNQVLTATATSPTGNTSEFSQCFPASPSRGSVSFGSTFQSSFVNVVEGVDSEASFVVTRTGGTAGPLTVSYVVLNATATAGSDFTPTQGTFTFADGETSRSFSVPIINDSIPEAGQETAKVTLSTSDDLDILGPISVATLTIEDNDPRPRISINDVTVNEGTNAIFTVTLSTVSGQIVKVNYATAPGTATAPGDYQTTNGTLTFAPGETSKPVVVVVNGDTLSEPNETFLVNLSSAANATFADQQGQGTIINVTPVVHTPSVTDASTNANTQTTSGLVISRNPADGAEVTHFKITGITGGSLFKNNGTTPINNGDFITFAEGNAGLKFTPGTTNGSFLVQASTSASDAGLGGGTVQATITVNASGGVIRFSAANYSVAEGAGSSTITVERTGDTLQAVTVDYISSDHSNPADFLPCTSPGAGFASSRCDFTTAIGTLRFAAGETSKTFNVLISQDNYVEGTETLELTLSNPTGGAVFGVPQTAILSITDDATEPATNPVDTSSEFVRSQYHDFLNREPDAPGLAFWTDNIEKCNDPGRRPAGQTAAECIDKQRESTAVAFFMSPEFQITGGFVYHLYKGSLTGTPNYDGGSPGRFPTSLEFMSDVRQVSEGIVVNNQISGAVVEANRNRLAEAFVQRPEFVAKYGALNNTLYVQELFNTTGIAATAAEKQALVDGLTGGTETKASVLRKVVDGSVVISESNVQFTTTYGQAFSTQENRRVFVFMEYVGYLRRNPDQAGFIFWLGKLNDYNGDPFAAEMVRAFILSPEYRNRFGQ